MQKARLLLQTLCDTPPTPGMMSQKSSTSGFRLSCLSIYSNSKRPSVRTYDNSLNLTSCEEEEHEEEDRVQPRKRSSELPLSPHGYVDLARMSLSPPPLQEDENKEDTKPRVLRPKATFSTQAICGSELDASCCCRAKAKDPASIG